MNSLFVRIVAPRKGNFKNRRRLRVVQIGKILDGRVHELHLGMYVRNSITYLLRARTHYNVRKRPLKSLFRRFENEW